MKFKLNMQGLLSSRKYWSATPGSLWQILRFVKDTGSSGFLPFKSGHLSALVTLTAAEILVLWLLPCRMKEEGEEEEEAVTFFKDTYRGVDMAVQVISHWPELRSNGLPYYKGGWKRM